MIKKRILDSKRIRRINGGFGFIPHCFLSDGFLSALSQKEILLYFLLASVSDRDGISYYNYDTICTLLQLSIDEYIEARSGLVASDLLLFDGTLFQLLSLPEKPIRKKISAHQDPATIRKIICESLGEKED